MAAITDPIADMLTRIRNANTVDVTVQYQVYRTGENGSLTLPAMPTGSQYSETWLRTNNLGAVLLIYNGSRVAEKPNANAGCASVASIGQWPTQYRGPSCRFTRIYSRTGKC